MTTVDDVAGSLRDDPFFIDPAAEQEVADPGWSLDADAQAAVSQRLADSPHAIYIAILPSNRVTDGTAEELSQILGDGTIVVLPANMDGGSAGSTELPDGRTRELIQVSLNNADGDLEAGLTDFADRVDNTLAQGTGNDSAANSGDGNGGGGGLLPLAILAGAGGGGFLLYRRNKRNRELTQLRQVRDVLDEDITKYGEQLAALDVDLHPNSEVPVKARAEYSEALDLYERAKDSADRAERPTDLKPVTSSLETGRWLLSCVDARINGEPVPERRLPCFFDPAHGPSVEDVHWAPPHGSARPVPACATCAHHVGAGEKPESRMVKVGDGEYRPYWDAGPAYAGWAGGYYGGLFPGLMIGTMLGHSLAMPHAGADVGAADGGGGDFSGGGFGDGGDFGGFGGGDFGGF